MVLSTSGIVLAGSHCNDAGTVCSEGSSQGGFGGGVGDGVGGVSGRGEQESCLAGVHNSCSTINGGGSFP